MNGTYDLVVCHGVLHLLEPSESASAIELFQDITRPGGVNVICVFTDRLPSPPDLVAFTHGLFREEELTAAYKDWHIEESRCWVFDDEHPGGIKHAHAAEKLVAWKPREVWDA